MRTAARFALLVVLGMAPIAGAATKVDVGPDTIACNTVVGTASVKPGLVGTGPFAPIVVSLKGTLDGCTVTGPNAATVKTGSFSGKLSGASNNCTNLLGTTPLTGTLTFKWKADPSTPLQQTSSVVTVITLTGGLFIPGAPFTGQAYGLLSLGVSGITGAFTGGDGGTSASNSVVVSQDAQALGQACGTVKGITKFNLGIGTVTLK